MKPSDLCFLGNTQSNEKTWLTNGIVMRLNEGFALSWASHLVQNHIPTTVQGHFPQNWKLLLPFLFWFQHETAGNIIFNECAITAVS